MGFKKKYYLDVDVDGDLKASKKIEWYVAPVFAVFWLTLYLAIVMTQIEKVPKPLQLDDEIHHPDTFIAQRAENSVIGLTNIGPRVVGSIANEVTAVEYLTQQIAKVQAEASDYFEIELDVQVASGNYMHWSMVNMYQAIQNVVVKLSAKGATSENYLLINSHFDSVPGSPGAADDGAMVSVMLEVLRVLAKSQGPLEHPIVFLFNGAEENPLQGSHAFITQHKWAKNCKALINLDAAGRSGRELLFQSGPNHPWLVNYYRQVPHPYGNTVGEEVFQAGVIPSDTDFRIFRDHGGVPGLDMAYVADGFAYHTKYDTVNGLSKGSLQNTGDNVLVLAKAIGNAPEMQDTSLHDKGHVVFYDLLGWFIVYYTEDTGVIINMVVCVAALVAISVSLFFMSLRSGLSWKDLLLRFCLIFAIQIVSCALAAAVTLLIAIFMDGVGRSMTWFSANWIISGLYFCPMFFGMGILPALYLQRTKRDALSLGFRIQLFMHSHCLLLIIITIVLTSMGLRSAYFPMIGILFETFSLIVNLVTKLHQKGYWFAITSTICQILPFLYYTAAAHTAYSTLIPMTGRSGSGSNPDIIMAGVSIIICLQCAGFIIPLFMFFRKTVCIMASFLGIALLFIVIAVTPAGFPYVEETATQRFALIHTQRILYNADGTNRTDEAGILVYPQDRRIENADKYVESMGQKHRVSEYCDDEIFCGMPLYNHRWHKARERSFWIPIEEYPIIPGELAVLTLKATTDLDTPSQKRFEFTLSGPDHMTLFIDTKDDAKILNWSFNDTMLREKWEKPYFIYFSYGKDNTALEFTIDVEKSKESFDTPSLEIGFAGHYIHQEKVQTHGYQTFVQNFPAYSTINDWIATYESRLF